MIIKCSQIYSEEGVIDGYLEVIDGKIRRICRKEIGPVDLDLTQ